MFVFSKALIQFDFAFIVNSSCVFGHDDVQKKEKRRRKMNINLSVANKNMKNVFYVVEI